MENGSKGVEWISPEEAGADYLAEQVDIIAGIRNRKARHHSHFFHRRIWAVLGKSGVELILAALRQAYDAARSGDGDPVRDPYGYVGRIAKNIAHDRGVDL